MRRAIVASLLLLSLLIVCPPSASAEDWPTLDEFVASAELVILAEVVAIEDGRVTLTSVEVWHGEIDALEGRDDAGERQARLDEHGLSVDPGQRVVMWYTAHNQPNAGTYARHATAFPVDGETIVYAETGDPGEPQTVTLAELEKKLGSN